VSLQPFNAETIVLLANAELMLGKFDQALQHARQALAIFQQAGQGPARDVSSAATLATDLPVAHMIAGKALEAKHRPNEAAAEYRAILQESPGAPAADNAQKALAGLQQPMAASDK
jgi:tetratricopeptide (TPR) repeat protein